MKLEHEFEVPTDVETVWRLLLDLERVAPCLPGAELTEKVDDDHYLAKVKVKVGPMQMTYNGEVSIVGRDEQARCAVIEAKGTETRGQGRAQAVITTSLEAVAGVTKAHMSTDLQITGRVAQMGHGVIQDISNRLLGEFAACLSRQLDATDADANSHRDAVASTRPPSSGAPAPPAASAGSIGVFRLLLAVLRGRLRRASGRFATRR